MYQSLLAQVQTGGGGQPTLLSLPPNVLVNILAWLPVSSLPTVARVCRRIKILVANDGVFVPRLREMGLWTERDAPPLEPRGPRSGQKAKARQKIARAFEQLRTRPVLPAFATVYLQRGSFFEGSPEQGDLGLSGDVDADADWKLARQKEVETERLREETEREAVNMVVLTGGVLGASQLAAQNVKEAAASGKAAPAARASPRVLFMRQHRELYPYYVNLRDCRDSLQDSRVLRRHAGNMPGACLLLVRLQRYARARPVADCDAINATLKALVTLVDCTILSGFEAAHDAGRTEELATLARAAFVLNGGMTCANVYVSRIPALYDAKLNPSLVFVRVAGAEAAPATAEATAAENPPATAAATFQVYMTRLIDATRNVSDEIDAVFPPGVPTLVLFVHRLLQDNIADVLTKTLRDSWQLDAHTYVVTLATCIQQCTVLLELMLRKATRSVSAQLAEGRPAAEEANVPPELVRVIERVSAICRPYAHGYLDAEMFLQRAAARRALDNWRDRRAARAAEWDAHRTLLASLRGQPLAPAADTGQDTHGPEAVAERERAAAALRAQGEEVRLAHRQRVLAAVRDVVQQQGLDPPPPSDVALDPPARPVAGTNRALPAVDAPKPEPNTRNAPWSDDAASGADATVRDPLVATAEKTLQKEPTRELFVPGSGQISGLLSTELVLSLIAANRQAMQRCQIVTAATMEQPDDLEKSMTRLFVYLLDTVTNLHIKPAIAECLDQLNAVEPRVDGLSASVLEFFDLVHTHDLVIMMVDLYYCAAIAPYIDESNFLAKIVSEKKAFEVQLDDSVAVGLDRCVNILVEQVAFILDELQAADDFYPERRGIGASVRVVDLRPTVACRRVIRCLDEHARLFMGAADPAVLDIFFAEIGIRFFSVLVAHLKRRTISQLGALQLMCDLCEYRHWAVALANDQLARMFAVVKQLGHVFLVATPHDLKELLGDGQRFQGHLRVEELHELLQSRADWKAIQLEVEGRCLIM